MGPISPATDRRPRPAGRQPPSTVGGKVGKPSPQPASLGVLEPIERPHVGDVQGAAGAQGQTPEGPPPGEGAHVVCLAGVARPPGPPGSPVRRGAGPRPDGTPPPCARFPPRARAWATAQGQKGVGHDRDGADASPFEFDGVVDTPRRAGASITDGDQGAVKVLGDARQQSRRAPEMARRLRQQGRLGPDPTQGRWLPGAHWRLVWQFDSRQTRPSSRRLSVAPGPAGCAPGGAGFGSALSWIDNPHKWLLSGHGPRLQPSAYSAAVGGGPGLRSR